MFGVESVRRPDSLQWLAGALEGNHWLLVHVWTVGKGTKGTLSNDVKDTRWECAYGMTTKDTDTTVTWATECAVCAYEKKCVARSRKCILCTSPVAFSELRLPGRENATNFWKNLDGGHRSRILSWMFPWCILLRFPWAGSYIRNCFIEYLWSDHLSSCQMCCCHPFQFENHSCELHQGVEDHWEDEDEGWEFAFLCEVLLPIFAQPFAVLANFRIEFVIQSLSVFRWSMYNIHFPSRLSLDFGYR